MHKDSSIHSKLPRNPPSSSFDRRGRKELLPSSWSSLPGLECCQQLAAASHLALSILSSSHSSQCLPGWPCSKYQPSLSKLVTMSPAPCPSSSQLKVEILNLPGSVVPGQEPDQHVQVRAVLGHKGRAVSCYLSCCGQAATTSHSRWLD